MDVKFFRMEEYYCDIGSHAGETAVRFKATVYLTDEELEQYHKSGGYKFDIVIPDVVTGGEADG